MTQRFQPMTPGAPPARLDAPPAARPAQVAASGSEPRSSTAGASEVSVEQVRVRITGTDPVRARQVVEDAVAMAARRLPAGLSGDVPALRVKVSARRASPSDLAEAIARELTSALSRTGGGKHA